MIDLRGLRVCAATSAHKPNDDRIFFKEARSLVKAGADVTIVCPEDGQLPDDPNGVHFVTFKGGHGLLRRMASLRTLEQTLLRQASDVIHCHEPDSLLAALRVKQRNHVRVIFDSHESWAAVAGQRFPRVFWTAAQRAFSVMEQRWLERCDAGIGASWAISEYLAAILGQDRVATILNVPVVEVFGERRERTWGDETILCHDGHLGFDRGLTMMAEAVRRVSMKHRIILKIVGDVFGKERVWLEQFVARNALQNVIVRTGWLPYEEVGQAIAPCHIGLIGLQEVPNNVVTSSNKVFNYLLYGMPFIGPRFRLSKVKLVQEDRCGVLADSSDPESYAGAICHMIENRNETLEMSQNASRASREKFRWEHMEPVLLELYERVLGSAARH